jgi:hypothetical protein
MALLDLPEHNGFVMVVGYPKFNNDTYRRNLEPSDAGFSDECGIYKLVRRLHDGHVFRFFPAKPLPAGYEPFYTQYTDPYRIAKRL